MTNQEKKKNRRYKSSSEDEESINNLAFKVPHGTSTKVPAPNPLLQNKLKVLLKSKSAKTSAIRQQKETSVGKIFSCNKSTVRSSNLSNLTYSNATLSQSSEEQQFLLNDGKYLLHIIIAYIFVI